MKTQIHINQHNIKANRKGQNLPVITVKDYKQNRYGRRVRINGPSEVVYSPDSPLSCGAHCWVETTATVDIID